MTKEKEKLFKKELKDKSAPKIYNLNNYPVSIKYCPRYEGYIPKNLGHEVCKYCGQIEYYH